MDVMMLIYKLLISGSVFFILCFLVYRVSRTRALSFFEKPGAVKIFHGLIYLSLVLLLGLDFVIHKHDYFELGNAPEFYAVFSVVACAVLMVIAKVFRFLLKRDEDYYEK